MSDHTLLPHGEDLRRAVRWLSEHHQHDIRAIEEACIRFDLSPLDEEFFSSSTAPSGCGRGMPTRRSWRG